MQHSVHTHGTLKMQGRNDGERDLRPRTLLYVVTSSVFCSLVTNFKTRSQRQSGVIGLAVVTQWWRTSSSKNFLIIWTISVGCSALDNRVCLTSYCYIFFLLSLFLCRSFFHFPTDYCSHFFSVKTREIDTMCKIISVPITTFLEIRPKIKFKKKNFAILPRHPFWKR